MFRRNIRDSRSTGQCSGYKRGDMRNIRDSRSTGQCSGGTYAIAGALDSVQAINVVT